MRSIFFLTGETSGDILASQVISQFREKNPQIKISGVCGPHMRALEVEEVDAMENFMTISPLAFFCGFFLFYRAKKVQKNILALMPDVCVFVDASWLSFKMASWLRSAGYQGKIFKYVCPNLFWPDHGRRDKLAKLFDGLISIFPHEQFSFADTSFPVAYVGHPLLLSCKQTLASNFQQKQQILVFFPGSRAIEIKWGFKKLLSAVLEFKARYPHMKIAVSCASPTVKQLIVSSIGKNQLQQIQLVDTFDEESKYQLMQSSAIALAKPGTNNIELACFQIPTLITFPLPNLVRWAVKKFIKEKREHYAFINYLNVQALFPEILINQIFSTEHVISELEKLAFDEKYREHIKMECKVFTEKLKNPHPEKNVADVLLEWA